jgi:hypothetical protein
MLEKEEQYACLPEKQNLVLQRFACTNMHCRTECKHRVDETFEIQAMFLLMTLILQDYLETSACPNKGLKCVNLILYSVKKCIIN